jgi:D-glycero-beta-D-manno-heptose 1-phosphate adenylyltransferase
VSQVLSASEVAAQCAAWKSAGRRFVFTNGHFDVLHLGHVEYLERARALGDALVVGVNGDASTRALKGMQRPIVPATERARLIASLRCVDAAVIFESLTAEALVAQLRPDIYVKGGDWALAEGRTPPEAAAALACGGEVIFLPYLPGHSTTDIIQTILERYGRRG